MNSQGDIGVVPDAAAIGRSFSRSRPVSFIFFVSGGSALINQIVWTRSLHRVFGVTAPAASTVLAAFMAGLAIGSYALGRWADRRAAQDDDPNIAAARSLRLYAVLELLIGLLAPLTLAAFRALEPIYAAVAGVTGLDSAWLPILRGALSTAVLLPPTILMGGTLPVLARGYLQGQPGRVTAWLYSINTWGAVFGCFLSGYILLGTLGETRSLLLAATGNVLAAAWAWNLSRIGHGKHEIRPSERAAPASDGTEEGSPRSRSPVLRVFAEPDVARNPARLVLAVSFINGFAALALEVLWGRTVGLFTDASVYAFTGIIGVFLIGIATGSRIAGAFADRVRSPLRLLGLLSAGMGLALLACIAAFVWWLSPRLPVGGTPVGPGSGTLWMPVRTIGMAAAMIAPVTILSGACFPIMARAIVRQRGREGRELGLIFSINTLGGIAGAALAGFVLLPRLGDSASFFGLASLYALSGAACLWAAGHSNIPQKNIGMSNRDSLPASSAQTARHSNIPQNVGTSDPADRSPWAVGKPPDPIGARVAASGLRWLALPLLAPVIGLLVVPPGRSLSRTMLSRVGRLVDHVETAEGTVTALNTHNGKVLLVNGTGVTYLCTDTKFMAHLPLALHPSPQHTLVICFGMGTTFRSAAVHPSAVTAVELQPAVTQLFSFYHEDAQRVLADPKNRIVIGDGRNFLLLADERYSVITVDPAPPMFSAGTVNLYTREFFMLCRDRLDEAGVMCLWLPDNSCIESDFRLILRTFHDVFPDCQVWIGPDRVGYYLIGSRRPLTLRPQRRSDVFDDPQIQMDILEYAPQLPEDGSLMLAELVMDAAAVEQYVAVEPRLLTDDRPYTEFPWLTWLALRDSFAEAWMNIDRLAPPAARP